MEECFTECIQYNKAILKQKVIGIKKLKSKMAKRSFFEFEHERGKITYVLRNTKQ